MQCSVTLGRDPGNKMKTINNFKNPYKKEPNLDNIVDQLCTRLQDIKDHDCESRVGMPTCITDHTEAVRRYNAAFPALTKGKESPFLYYLPPPPAEWCRKTAPGNNIKMQSELVAKDWNNKTKKYSGKERRNSYHGQRKSNRKRCNSYSRSFESKESLPEWVTHEGVWDMETQDPVKEFIRAIALDEGYGTCENTVTDEIKDITQVEISMNQNLLPDWEDSLDLQSAWVITEDLNPRVRTPMEEELYAKFEAKFDRSIEALWSKDQNTPDDEYQDLPIDFQELLSSPSDHLFADPCAEKCSMISLTESIWSNDGLPVERVESPCRIVEVLHDRFKPLNLADGPEPAREVESFALYEEVEIEDAVATVAETLRSFTAINHSRERSGFAEVPPRRHAERANTVLESKPAVDVKRVASQDEDLLTASRTHFRPIRAGVVDNLYADGDSFDIRGDLDTVQFRRSDSGGVYLQPSLERYLEYRASKGIDYGRLKLTAAQRCPDLEDPGFRLRFPMRQTDAAVQTDRPPDEPWGCDGCGSAKKMRPSAMSSIWSSAGPCAACAEPPTPAALAPPPDDLSREWEELLCDISAAHADYARAEVVDDALVSAERKRRHSAALRCDESEASLAQCTHPHARFLHCCAQALDRPLTR